MGQATKPMQVITIVTVALATHRRGKLIFLQPLLVIVSAILTAAITVEDATLWRITQTHSHIERLDR